MYRLPSLYRVENICFLSRDRGLSVVDRGVSVEHSPKSDERVALTLKLLQRF